MLPDVSTTMIIRPGSVVEFLVDNQNVRDPYSIDWAKVRRKHLGLFVIG